MRELVTWLRADHGVHPVLVAGIAQYQLVHIHPFVDGNGRTSRLLSTLCLYRSGYDFKRLFTLSEYYDRDRAAFYNALQGVREYGVDLTGWLTFFVHGLSSQMAEVRTRGEQVILRDVIVREQGLSERQGEAVGALLRLGELRVEDLAAVLPNVHRRTLQRDLRSLVDRRVATSRGAGKAVRYRLTDKHLARIATVSRQGSRQDRDTQSRHR